MWRPHRRRRPVIVTVAGVLMLSALQLAPMAAPAGAVPGKSGDNMVLQWNDAALQGVRVSGLGPPQVARALAIVHTCIYDAWAAYDPVAVGTRLGGSLRVPGNQRSLTNRNKAVSFAAYRAAVDLFPKSVPVFDSLMTSLGYDKTDMSTNIHTATGIGNVACQAVLDFRHHDGSNQLGDLHPGAYSDYTGFTAVNKPMDVSNFDPSTVIDPNKWQPLKFVGPTGATVTQTCVGMQFPLVAPFALTSDSEFRSQTGPATYGSAQYLQQAQDLIAISANLTDEQKVIAEYWANGPKTELPPGHWDLFAQFVSHRDHHSLDDDVKMFFAMTNAIMDAGIVAWDNKKAWDSVRPITAIRYLFQGQQIQSWGGPGKGTVTMDGSQWTPYQASDFPTPPFQEYSSGHSTFSGAGAEVLKLFTGSDDFGDSVTIPAGQSVFEPGQVPAAPVMLSWSTFTAAADQAGISRRYGGIHFEQADLDGRANGHAVGAQAWQKALTYFNGTAM